MTTKKINKTTQKLNMAIEEENRTAPKSKQDHAAEITN